MTDETTRLSDRIALVTGASSGVGAATARKLAKSGATVALVARRRDRLEALAAEIGASTTVHAADLYDPTAAPAMVADVLSVHGRIDILVNNAGSMLSGPVASADPANFRKMTELNFLAPVLATHAVIPAMRQAKGGHLVFVGSLGARFCTPGNAVYAATKAAVQVFAETLRKELVADRVRVTTVIPGFIATEIVDHVADPTTKDFFSNFMKSMTLMQPEDIAEAIHFAVTQPAHVTPNDIVIRPTEQPN